MHGAPADFLADTTGGTVRSAEGTDGHGRGRSCLRRVPLGWRGVVVSVVPGRGVGRVGFCSVASGGRAGRSGPASPVSVSRVCRDSCVVAGVVVAAQGVYGGGDLGGAGGQGRRCRASSDRFPGGYRGVHCSALAGRDGRSGRGGARVVSRGRGGRGGGCVDPAGDRNTGGRCAGRGGRGAGGDRVPVRRRGGGRLGDGGRGGGGV